MKKPAGKKPSELLPKIEVVTGKPASNGDSEPENAALPISGDQIEHLLDAWSDVVEAIDRALEVTDSMKHADDLLEVKLLINSGITAGLSFDNFHARVHPHCAADEYEDDKTQSDVKKLS